MGLWLHPSGLSPNGEDHESENWALATDIEDLGFSNGDWIFFGFIIEMQTKI